jgi:predicted AAA+ superfamily ATPase
MLKNPRITETTNYMTGSGSKDLENILYKLCGSELNPTKKNSPQAQVDTLNRNRQAEKIMFLSNEDVYLNKSVALEDKPLMT